MGSGLFDPVSLKTLRLTLRLTNRFVFAAAASGNPANGSGVIHDSEVVRLTRYAKSGVGLVITGAIGITDSAISGANSCLLSTDATVTGFERLTDSIHIAGGLVAAQLCHSGLWTSRHNKEMGQEAIAPSHLDTASPYTDRPGFINNYHAATEDEIEGVIASFGAAAERAAAAGFDAVEIHGAHDSLLAQFLSPLTNQRTDRWGGSLVNRVRIHCEVIRAIRKNIGNNYPVFLKMGAADGIFGPGLTFAEGLQAAGLCARSGYDVLEVSQGLQGTTFAEMALRSPIKSIDQEGFSRSWCREIKKATGIPTSMTGGLRSLELVEEIVKNGETDFIGLCRPLIREPELILRWKAGDRKKSTCISCNKCGLAIAQGLPLDCYVDKKLD